MTWARVADDALVLLALVAVLTYWYFRDRRNAIREDARAERAARR
jgi:hypothetical protein